MTVKRTQLYLSILHAGSSVQKYTHTVQVY